MLLDNSAVILVHTTCSGNIGAAARAMKTMGMTDLRLVGPKDFPSKDASAMAAGSEDVLASAKIFKTLEDAIADREVIMGTSARERNLPWPLIRPRDMAEVIASKGEAPKVALVFGQERAGLTNEQLALCHYHINIPTSETFKSLNLAQAVQVLCYELRCAMDMGFKTKPIDPEHGLVSGKELDLFYEHLEKVLIKTDFLDPANPKRLIPRLQRLFNRAQVEKIEMNILRGILNSIERKL